MRSEKHTPKKKRKPFAISSIIEYRVFEHVYNFRQRPAICAMVQYLISPTQYTHCSCCHFQNGRRTLSYDFGIGYDKMKCGCAGASDGDCIYLLYDVGTLLYSFELRDCRERDERKNCHVVWQYFYVMYGFSISTQRNLTLLRKTFPCIQFSSGYVGFFIPFLSSLFFSPLVYVRVWFSEFTFLFFQPFAVHKWIVCFSWQSECAMFGWRWRMRLPDPFVPVGGCCGMLVITMIDSHDNSAIISIVC